jgi:hypothetical protein
MELMEPKLERSGAELKWCGAELELHCRKSWRNISFPSDISELFHEDIITNISEKCSP